MTSFALDLAAFAKKAENNAQTVVRKISIDLFSKTVLRTPVDTGRARANWNCSIGAPSFTVSQKTDKGGTTTQAGIRSTLGNWKDGDIYLMNSLPYIRRLEYDGWSGQAPQGMVRITMTEFQTFVDGAVRSVK